MFRAGHLNYRCYKWLQRYVHGDYANQKKTLLKAFADHRSHSPHPSIKVLELGCGDGVLAAAFPAGSFLGLDNSEERIAVARRTHPGHLFGVCDLRSEDLRDLVRDFDFIYCHAVLHHLNDMECASLVDTIQRFSRKPTTFVALEPVLPQLWENPFGFIVGKLDDGRHVRSSADYRAFFRTHILWMETYPLRWPQSEEAYVVRYQP